MDLLNFYKDRLSSKLTKLAEPLNTYFGLDGFFYTYLSPKGEFFQIGNRADVGETYFSNELYQANPLFCHPDNYLSLQSVITDDLHHDPFHTAQDLIKNSYGFKNFYCIPKFENGCVHLFMFTSSNRRLPLNSIFLENSYALEQFAVYFFENWKQNLPKMDPFLINMGELIGPRYFRKDIVLSQSSNKTLIRQFGEKIGLIDSFAQIDALTKREKDCIRLLLKGKTAPQIGESLGISDRTVFDYLDHVKDKLGCASKTELFELLQIYEKLKLI